MALTSDMIAGFTKTFLLKHYDNPVPIPDFHRELWEDCCSDNKRAAIAAPRGHAKSTAVTMAYVMASVLFRESKFVLVVSNTEQQSIDFLNSVKVLFKEDEDLIAQFGIRRFPRENETMIIVEMNDGYKFRIDAKSTGAKGIRGTKWVTIRPDLIIGDDLEDDEMVESELRREKFKSWFRKALLPCLAKGRGKIRIVGTILHMDAMLARLLDNKKWAGKLYRAHTSFNDFSDILWPEQFSEEDLRDIQEECIADGRPEFYSQEYLNNPIDQHDPYFHSEDFIPMDDDHKAQPMLYYGAVDFAISDQDKNAYSVAIVGGYDSNNMLNIVKVLRFRGNADDIINNVLALQLRYSIEFWKMERGQISMAIGPAMRDRAISSNIHLNIQEAVPTKDKRSRARSIQARMKAGGVRFDTESSWFPSFQEELLHFPRGMYKDQVDAFAWLGIAINELAASPTEQELDDDEYERWLDEEYDEHQGVSAVTGY